MNQQGAVIYCRLASKFMHVWPGYSSDQAGLVVFLLFFGAGLSGFFGNFFRIRIVCLFFVNT